MKKLLRLGIVSTLAFSSLTYAACPTTVTVSSLGPAAKAKFTALNKSFDTVFMTSATIDTKSAMANIKNAQAEQNIMLAQTILQSSQNETNSQIEDMRMVEELNIMHMSHAATEKRRSKSALIPEDGLDKGATRAYFAKMCNNNKLSNFSFGLDNLKKKNEIASNNNLAGEVVSTKSIPSAFKSREAQMKHYSNYCAESDISSGLCKESATVPSADMLSFVALRPNSGGDNPILAGTDYKKEYTYSDSEKEAAKDYFNNIIAEGRLSKPTSSMYEGGRNMGVISRYEQLISAQNIARFSLGEAYSSRVPLNDSDQMSRLDGIRYLIWKSETEDADLAMNTTSKGKLSILLSQGALEMQLRKEISERRERINNLLATYVAVRQGSPDIIKLLNSKR